MRMEEYWSAAPGETLPPHVFGVAATALDNMVESGNNQSIIISGVHVVDPCTHA